MSEAYIPDCTKCEEKMSCCNPVCIQRLTEKKYKERHKYDWFKEYLLNKTPSSPEEAEEIKKLLGYIEEHEKS